MQTVSAAYKEQMRRPLRNRSYVRVSYGVFNLLAGQQAEFTDNGHTAYANLNLNDDILPDRDYATFERDYWRADGKQLILPATGPYNYDGFVSSEVSNLTDNTFAANPTITVSFTDPQDIFGLTLTFPEGQVPQEIKVNGTTYNPDSELYIMPDRLQDVTSITIKFVRAPAAGRRVRLNRLQFGQSVVFQNRQLIKTSFESSIDFLSLSLTQKKFTFTIDNRDQAYNPLNPTGIYSYLEAKQPLDMEYGYELDDGSIEWVQGDSTVSESTPIAADAQASFSAVDALTNLTGMFRYGLYRENRNLIDNNFSAWESGQYQPSDGGKANITSRLRLSELVAVKPSTTYYCDTESDFQEVIRTYDSSRNFLSSIGAIQNGQTFTTPAGAYFISVTLFNPLDETIAYDYQSLFADGTIKPFMCLNSIVDKSYAPHDNKISLYDLAEEVLTDAGVEHYSIDGHLKDIYTKAALPIVTHRECLQIIANAGQCILYTDRRGYITLEIALDPTIQVGDNGHMAYSSSESAYNDENLPTAKYADFLPDSWKAAGAKILLPAAGPYIRMGFVSDKICDADGAFSTYPVFFWTYSFPYSAFQIPIMFDNVDGECAAEFDVVYKLAGAEIDRVSVTGNTAVKYIVEHSVDKTDRIEIEIHKWCRGTRRAMIAQIGSGRVNDMNIDFSTATSKPTVEKSSQVKTVTVNCYSYVPAADVTELYHSDITLGGDITLNVSHDAATEIAASLSAGTIVSQTHYTYYSVLTLTGTGAATLSITGKVLTAASVSVVKQLNPQGEDKPALQNPLITDLTNAQNTAIWIADYFSKRNFLTTTYRGNPEIDAHDLAYMESQFEALFPVRIMDHKIEFNGALSGSVKAVKMNG
jgi:hypothetical protein